MGSRNKLIPPVFFTMLLLFSIYLPYPAEGSISFLVNSSPVSDTVTQSDLDMEVVGSGNSSMVFLTYEDHKAGINTPHVFFKRSLDGGSTWGSEVDLLKNRFSGNRQVQPEMDTYTDGCQNTIAIVYLDSSFRPIPGLQEYVIVCEISIDNGTNWNRSLVTPLNNTTYPSDSMRNPNVKFGIDGSLFVVWEELEGDDRIFISYSLDNGKNWSRPQKVCEPADPENPAMFQRYPDIACDGEKVYVAWEADPDYKVGVFLSSSVSPSSPNQVLKFSESKRMAHPFFYPMYWLFKPVLEADDERIYLAWWDFSTDPNGADNEDIAKDRPCVKFTSSNDQGRKWSVNGSANKIVNKTSPYVWHSQPNLDVNDGLIAISWIDWTLNGTMVVVSVSNDNGSSFSIPIRANDYRSKAFHYGQRISVDDGGHIHSAWLEKINGSDPDIYHTRTDNNTPPEAVRSTRTLETNETSAIIMWDINTESDFDRYEIFLSNEILTYDNREWPEGELYEVISDQSKSSIFLDKKLEADTRYNFAVRVVDVDGEASDPSEGSFRTLPLNQPPAFTETLPDIQMKEDNNLPSAINLSELIELGLVVDDGYGGHSDLDFEIESDPLNENITGNIVRRNGSIFLDMVISFRNWHGSERFRLLVRDTGKDGCFYTSDDLTSTSNWFDAVVDPVNDPPVFEFFMDLMTGWRSEISPQQTSFDVDSKVSGCFEKQKYSFAINGRDVDGDFLTFTADDPRLVITVDNIDPKCTSVISFTPTNDDVPWLELTMEVTDGEGGFGELALNLWVHDHDSPPFFRTAAGRDVNTTGDVVHLEVEEKSPLTFSVEGDDADPNEKLELISSIRDGVLSILSTGDSTWNVTVNSEWQMENDSFTFDLYLLDRAKVNMAVLKVILSVKYDDPTLFIPWDWLEVSYTFDISDSEFGSNPVIRGEWNELVTFRGNAVASRNFVPLWTWEIKDDENRTLQIVDGNPLSIRFQPYDGKLGYVREGVFNLVATVRGKGVEPVQTGFRITITSDGDDDNDGLPDDREIIHFGSLDNGPEEDFDGDGYSNKVEMMNPLGSPTDPVDPLSYPGSSDEEDPQRDPDVPHGIDLSAIHPVLIVSLLAVLFFVIVIVAGILVIIRRERRIEVVEEEEIEEKVRSMERRQEEIKDLYGVQRAGDVFGPDQSTMDDLVIDRGGPIFHGDDSMVILGTGGQVGGEISRGPLLEDRKEGPLFKNGLQIDELTP